MMSSYKAMSMSHSRVYLSAADRQLETYIKEEGFERNLLIELLFQPSVLIPDSFIFTSTGIAHHLEADGLTLLEAGLQSGDIVPSFRDQSISDFAGALRVAKGSGDQRQGILSIRHDADWIANRLDSALTRSNSFAPQYWPQTSVGRRFQEIVEKFLSNGSVPRLPADSGIPQSRMVELWNHTERWRTECVFQAIEETAKVAGEGLRRGELITAVGSLVTGNPEFKVDPELIDHPFIPLQDQIAFRCIRRWITDLYQYNQACELGAIPSFPQCDPVEGVFANEILAREREETDGNKAHTELRLKAPMPARSALSHIPSAELLEIKNDKGAAYLAALKKWQDTSESPRKMEQDLQDKLTNYGNALVQEVNRRGQTGVGVIEAVLSLLPGLDPILPWSLQNVVTAAPKSPTLRILMTVCTNGYAVYRWWRRYPDEAEVRLVKDPPTSSASIKPDVNLVLPNRSSPPPKSDAKLKWRA